MALFPGFFSFIACFAILSTLWHRHVQFFRRYGLYDTATVALNTVLLALVLFYLYPLKFLMNSVCEVLEYAVMRTIIGPHPKPQAFSNAGLVPRIMSVYMIGFGAVSLAFALLYRHALRRRADLKLSPFEEAVTLDDFALWTVATLCTLIAAAWTRWAPHDIAPLGSFFLFAIPLIRKLQKRRRAARAQN